MVGHAYRTDSRRSGDACGTSGRGAPHRIRATAERLPRRGRRIRRRLTPLGAPCPPGAVGDDGGYLPVEPRGVRVREQFLCGCGRSGVQKLEGHVLRIARSLQLHHRGQASGGAVGHGPLGPDFRIQHLERHGARRARGRGRGGAPLWRSPARRQSDGWSGGGSAAGGHARGCAHVPVRQSGRAPGPPARWRGVLHDPRHRESRDEMVAGRRHAPGLCLPHENDAGVHGGACVRPGLPDRSPDIVAPPRRATSRELGCPCHRGRMVGGHRLTRPRRRPTLHRRLAGQQHLESHLRLQRIWAAQRQRRRGQLQRHRRRVPTLQ